MKNYPSIRACPNTLKEPLAKIFSILSPPSSFNEGNGPRLVHPLLAIVRADDLLKAHKSLENMHRPFGGAKHYKRDLHELDALNAHIRAAKLSNPAGAKFFSLQEVTARRCLDLGVVNANTRR